MINDKLINPGSIAVIGGSDDITKPGGKVLKNIIDGAYGGKLYVVNPKSVMIQGLKSFADTTSLPQTDLAILAIPAKLCPQAIEILASLKSTKAFIVLSAGFGEEGPEGKKLEQEMRQIIDRHDGCLIGPNCIGILNPVYRGVFTTPVPSLDSRGIDLISGSGATAVFIMESAIPLGLKFASVWSVGNGAQVGIEEVLEYLDESFAEGISSEVKLLYIESISQPQKFLKHASSLVLKGCKLAAIKSGVSEAGSRAASSHTGALASPDIAIDALFRKAGITRCAGREELAAVASVFMNKKVNGKNIAIITHAGGPAVMLADALTKGGLAVPQLSGKAAESLKEKLFPGSSTANPIDFLATGNAEQLGSIIDACENDFNEVDAMAVIFGSPGLSSVAPVYDLIDRKMKSCKKAIFPVMPSVMNAEMEIKEFISKGNSCFHDETIFASALSKVINTRPPAVKKLTDKGLDLKKIRKVIDSAESGYLSPSDSLELITAAGIHGLPQKVVKNSREAEECAGRIGFPVVMKVTGPVHKSDVGGVVLNITDTRSVSKEYERLMKIKDAGAVLVQKMASGTELFAGVKFFPGFGYIILTGPGGILVEVMKDFSFGLAPLGMEEASDMIKSLRSYDIIKGTRGRKPVNERVLAALLCNLSELCQAAPEIKEMDLNPLICSEEEIFAADLRILVKKDK